METGEHVNFARLPAPLVGPHTPSSRPVVSDCHRQTCRLLNSAFSCISAYTELRSPGDATQHGGL